MSQVTEQESLIAGLFLFGVFLSRLHSCLGFIVRDVGT